MHGPSFIEQIYITVVTYGCIDTVDLEKIKYVKKAKKALPLDLNTFQFHLPKIACFQV